MLLMNVTLLANSNLGAEKQFGVMHIIIESKLKAKIPINPNKYNSVVTGDIFEL